MMSQKYQINNIQGTAPFSFYVCDTCETSATCFFIGTVNLNDLPYTFTIPLPLQNSSEYCFKFIDSDECEYCECINTTQ